MADDRVSYIIELRDKTTKTLKKINKNLFETDKTAQNLGSTFGRLGATIGAAALGKKILQLGVDMEQTRVAFGTFLGDIDKGNALIAELNEFANVTPFDNAQVIKSGKVLLSAGIAADKMTDTLKAVGDVASGANVPLTELSAIYSKAMNKGKVQAEELNQLSERGVPILQTFASMYGITTAEVMKLGSEGKLTSDKLAEAFKVMTGEGGMFFNMMEKQSQTAGGKFSTVLGKLQTEGIKLGESALPSLTKGLEFVLKNFDALVKTTKTAVKIIALYKGSIMLTKVAVLGFSKAHKVARIAMVVFSRGVKGASRSLKGFKTALLTTGIGAFVVALGFVIEKIIEMRDKAKEAREEQNKLSNALGNFVAKFGAIEQQVALLGTMNKRQAEAFKGSIEAQIEASEDLTQAQLLELKKRFEGDKKLAELKKQLAAEERAEQKAFIQQQIKNRKQELAEDLEAQNKTNRAKLKQLQGYLNKANARIKQLGGEEVTIKPDDGAKDTIATITGAAPKTFNIKVNNLIENFEISTQNLQESADEVKNAVTVAMAEALADVQPMSD